LKQSVDYHKVLSKQADSRVHLQQAVVCAAFQDIMNESLAFHETTVKITVVEANALMAMDSNGFSDPYCEVIVRHVSTGKKVFPAIDKTAIVPTSLNPRWNFSKEYTLQSAAIVEFRCKDHDEGMRDDFLGCASIDLSDIRKEEVGTVQDMWLTLCDEPSKDIKHDSIGLLSLTPNAARGKVGTLLSTFHYLRTNNSFFPRSCTSLLNAFECQSLTPRLFFQRKRSNLP
jgi:hypothetical protein